MLAVCEPGLSPGSQFPSLAAAQKQRQEEGNQQHTKIQYNPIKGVFKHNSTTGTSVTVPAAKYDSRLCQTAGTSVTVPVKHDSRLGQTAGTTIQLATTTRYRILAVMIKNVLFLLLPQN